MQYTPYLTIQPTQLFIDTPHHKKVPGLQWLTLGLLPVSSICRRGTARLHWPCGAGPDKGHAEDSFWGNFPLAFWKDDLQGVGRNRTYFTGGQARHCPRAFLGADIQEGNLPQLEIPLPSPPTLPTSCPCSQPAVASPLQLLASALKLLEKGERTSLLHFSCSPPPLLPSSYPSGFLWYINLGSGSSRGDFGAASKGVRGSGGRGWLASHTSPAAAAMPGAPASGGRTNLLSSWARLCMLGGRQLLARRRRHTRAPRRAGRSAGLRQAMQCNAKKKGEVGLFLQADTPPPSPRSLLGDGEHHVECTAWLAPKQIACAAGGGGRGKGGGGALLQAASEAPGAPPLQVACNFPGTRRAQPGGRCWAAPCQGRRAHPRAAAEPEGGTPIPIPGWDPCFCTRPAELAPSRLLQLLGRGACAAPSRLGQGPELCAAKPGGTGSKSLPPNTGTVAAPRYKPPILPSLFWGGRA